MTKIAPAVYQNIEEQFLEDFKRYYGLTNELQIKNCREKLFNSEYPVEFYMFLFKTKKLAKYSIILTKLKPFLYSVNSELIYNGLNWFKITYGAEINSYIHKRIKDKDVDAWITIHRDWDKYRKKHNLYEIYR